jgi:hypothetical protein
VQTAQRNKKRFGQEIEERFADLPQACRAPFLQDFDVITPKRSAESELRHSPRDIVAAA